MPGANGPPVAKSAPSPSIASAWVPTQRTAAPSEAPAKTLVPTSRRTAGPDEPGTSRSRTSNGAAPSMPQVEASSTRFDTTRSPAAVARSHTSPAVLVPLTTRFAFVSQSSRPSYSQPGPERKAMSTPSTVTPEAHGKASVATPSTTAR